MVRRVFRVMSKGGNVQTASDTNSVHGNSAKTKSDEKKEVGASEALTAPAVPVKTVPRADLFDFGLKGAGQSVESLANNLNTISRPKLDAALDSVTAFADSARIPPTLMRKIEKALDVVTLVGLLLAAYIVVLLIQRLFRMGTRRSRKVYATV